MSVFLKTSFLNNFNQYLYPFISVMNIYILTSTLVSTTEYKSMVNGYLSAVVAQILKLS